MKKKICFAMTSIIGNGVTRVVSILLDEIDYDQYDVSVLLTRKISHARALNPKARILEVSKDLGSGIRGKIDNVCELHQILKKENFDVIFALGDYAAMYVLLACYGIRAKRIVSERNDPNREPDKKMFRRLRDILYRSADAIVCQTSDAARYYENIVRRRVVIPNPVSGSLPMYTGAEREKRIVNFCRIDGQKNLPMLVDAFGEFVKDHPEYILEIYGNGPDEEIIRAYIREKGLDDTVVMKDFSPSIHEKVLHAGMFVSTSDFEGMSNSMLESMAMGLPVICTDCPIGGAHEVIESGKNGILIPVNDRGALLEAMNLVANFPETAQRMSEQAVKIRQRLSKSKISSQWWALLEDE